MDLKKNIVLGMVTGLVGMALISGGTVAYFSDEVKTENKILSGHLDLDISELSDEDLLFEFENIKPGMTFDHSFDLINNGSLKMEEIKLFSKHKITNQNDEVGNNGFASRILIKELHIDGSNILEEAMSLKELHEEPLILAEQVGPGANIQVYVLFEFYDTGKKQNQFQGNKMDLTWTFEAIQTDDPE